MSTMTRRVARKPRVPSCRCPQIKPGEVYVEHVYFPGEDGAEHIAAPCRLSECARCATRAGRGGLLAPTR